MELEEVSIAENGKLQQEQELGKMSKGSDELQRQECRGGDGDVLRLLDSLDCYLILMDSLQSSLRQGWLDLAGARHSMGVSRVNSALLDLNSHYAATTLQVTEQCVDSMGTQTQFSLCKWASSGDGNYSVEAKCEGEKLHDPQLRHRGGSEGNTSPKGVTMRAPDDQVKKERSKPLAVFGALVSPKLRSTQSSFETALEAIVEIANARSAMLSAYDQVQKELEVAKT